MKRLMKQSNLENDYKTFCEAIAYDLKNDDMEDGVDEIAKETIDSIKNREFLSDFEKIVKEYFEEKKLALAYETIASDISKFF